MRQDILRDKAITLQKLLQKYAAQSKQAKDALNMLDVLLKGGISGKLTKKVDWADVPCSYMFLDGELGAFKDLENAYATFKAEITGNYDTPLHAKIQEMRDQKK